MNTKGIKFLAVLAVLVMAFAAIAVVAPAETDAADPVAVSELPSTYATTELTANGPYFLALGDSNVTIAGVNGSYNPVIYIYAAAGNTKTITVTTVSTGTLTLMLTTSTKITDGKVDPAGTIAIKAATGGVYTLDSTAKTVKVTGATEAGANSVYAMSVAELTSDVDRTVKSTTYYDEAESKVIDKENSKIVVKKGTADITVKYKSYGPTATATSTSGTEMTVTVGFTKIISTDGIAIQTYLLTEAHQTAGWDAEPNILGTATSGDIKISGTGIIALTTPGTWTNGALDAGTGKITAVFAETATVDTANVTASKITASATGPIALSGSMKNLVAIDSIPQEAGTQATKVLDANGVSQYDLYILGAPEIGAIIVGTHEVNFLNGSATSVTAKNNGKTIAYAAEGLTAVIPSTGILPTFTGALALNSGEFTASNTDTNGNFTIGTAGTTSKLTIGKNATLNAGAEVTGIVISDDAALVLYGTINAYTGTNLTITQASNDDDKHDGTFAAYSGAVLGQNVYIDLSAEDMSLGSAMKDVELTTELTSNFTGNQIQNIVITKDLVIRPGVTLSTLGGLTVNPGVTLTVSGTATLNLGIAGTFQSNSATADIQGEIDAKQNSVINFKAGNGFDVTGTITNDGTMAIESQTTFKSGSQLAVTSNGTLTAYDNESIYFASGSKGVIEGTLAFDATTDAILVAGTFEIDGKVTIGATGANYIYTVGDGAKVILSSVTFTDNLEAKTLKISDVGTVLKDSSGTPVEIENGNCITISKTAVANHVLSGLAITQNVAMVDDVLYSTLDLSGSVSSGTANVVTIGLAGTAATATIVTGMTVTETLSIGEKVQFINNSAPLVISGEMYKTVAGEPIKFESTGTYGPDVTVTGLLSVINKNYITQINAAYFETTVLGVKYFNYTSFEDALELGENFKLLGNIYVYDDLVIPAPVQVDASGAKIYVGDGDHRNASLTVKDGAKLTINEAYVDGTLVFEDYTTGKKVGEITSDVYNTSDKMQIFTNIYTALAMAEAGDEITVTKDTGAVVLDKSVTIPAGVLVTLDAGKALKLNDGVTLTVNGTLASWDALQTDTGTVFVNEPIINPAGKVRMIVNGVFGSVATADYNTYKATGAYYTYTDVDATFNMITDFAVVPMYIDDKAKTVSIYGDETAGDVLIAGDYKIGISVPVGSSLSIGTLGIANATVTAAIGGAFTGTIASEEGAVKFTNAVGFTVEEKTYKSVDTMYLSGAISGGKGTATFATSISAGAVVINSTVSVKSITIASGATLSIISGGTLSNTGTTTINGTLIVTDGGIFNNTYANVDGKGGVVVLGALYVDDADIEEGTAAGNANIKKLYVGVKASDVFTTGAGATVEASVISGLEEVFVLAGSEISSGLVENMIKSVFVIEDSEYMTVYTTNATTLTADVIDCPVSEEVEFECWTYVKSGEVVPVDDTKLTTSRTYTAYILYDVYTLFVKADNGIKSIAVDGKELINLYNNVFVSYDEGLGFMMSAGKYTLTFTLKDGYEGTPILYDADGKAVIGGYGITIDGADRLITYQLSGTDPVPTPEPTPTPEPEKESEWNVTTILLLVLVILIAIMAVIVALRLNRN